MPYKDRDKQNEWHRLWRLNNPEKAKAKYKKDHLNRDKERAAALNKIWRESNKERIAGYKRVFNQDYYLNKRFGITKLDYENMLVEQKGVCKICNSPETCIDKRKGTLKRLAVDHCHTTGLVRGLLCNACNTSLGKFKDDYRLLVKAARYLIDAEKQICVE